MAKRMLCHAWTVPVQCYSIVYACFSWCHNVQNVQQTVTANFALHRRGIHGLHSRFSMQGSRLTAINHYRWNMYDLLNNRTAWWAPGKIVELRRRLEPIWRVCRGPRGLHRV